MKRILALLVVLACLSAPVASSLGQTSPEVEYLGICEVIRQADDAGRRGDNSGALARYRQADAQLRAFGETFPTWNTNVIALRLKHLGERISKLQPAIPQVVGASADGSISAEAMLADAQRRLRTQAEAAAVLIAEANTKIEQQSRQLAELAQERDALRRQVGETAGISAEVARLKTENKSLRQQVADARTAPTTAGNEELNQQLSQVRAQLAAAETERDSLQQRVQAASAEAATTTQLRAENDQLKRRLADTTGPSVSAAKLDEVNRQLRQVQSQLALAESERDSLRKQVSASGTEQRTVAELKSENESLRRQLADARSAATPARNAGTEQQLRQVQAQLALARTEQDALRSQMQAMEQAAQTSGSAASARDTQRIKQLEQERDELQRRLVAATATQPPAPQATPSPEINDLMNQLAALRAKLDVYEAKPVPYTPEELALFKQPGTPVVAEVPPPATRSSSQGSAVSATLIAQAHRHFAAGDLAKAEQKYTEALTKENNDVRAYCNLATIQAQENRITEAENTIDRALAIDPDDAMSLGVLGYVKLRQDKYDDALSVLSRAVKSRSQDPRLLNMLGLALSHSGQRGPAETAFRRALQSDPSFADAHANLATIYITQKPPLVELARWHYNRAIAAGAPRNPDMDKLLADATPTAAR